MKKILLSVGVILTSLTATSQLFNASSAADFATFAAVDADGDTFSWGIYDLLTANAGAPVGTSFDAQGDVLGSFSYDNATMAALTPDNWIVSPAINLTGQTVATLSWGCAAVDPAYPAENYSVYVVSAADPATVVAALTAATPVFTETIATGDVWASKFVNINTFAGQNNVYVAFRHHACTDEFLFILDDIKITNVASIVENTITTSAYPNPTNDVLNIKLSANATSVSIIGLDGKVISSEVINANTAQVNVSNLVAGVYIYEIVAENGEVVRNTFVKK
jgi:hypothetical protein